MSAELEILTSDAVTGQLRESGIVEPSRSLYLQPMERNPERLDYTTRRAFRVWSGQKTLFYLLTGPGLTRIWNRAQGFAHACPEIASKPLFLQRTAQADFLGLEFIEGPTLEEAGLKGEAAPGKLDEAAAAALAGLERTLRPSSASSLHAELERFFAAVLACPVFGAIDGRFLRDIVFPLIRDGAGRQPAQTRWTNGDFIPQNIILDGQGAPRLIDYEYARRTHFYAEDFVRWRAYANVQKNFFDPHFGPTPPWLEAFFLLRQTVLEHKTGSVQLTLAGTEQRAGRLRELASSAHVQFRSSFFLKPLARDAEWRELNQVVEERTFWAKSLDKEVVKLREIVEAKEAELKEIRAASASEKAAAEKLTRQSKGAEELLRNLEDQMAHAQSLTAKLAADLEHERGRRAGLEDKVRRMQGSFSWKATFPLRVLRRVFLDEK